jgi:hypothetical protein
MASVSENIKAKSGLFDGFNPAVMPAALKPFGAVTPPLICCQSVIYFTLLFCAEADYIKSFFGDRRSFIFTLELAFNPMLLGT